MERVGIHTNRNYFESPIYSKFEGLCIVCRGKFYPGEKLSPYFEKNKNFYRHTSCLQLFFIVFKYSGKCNACNFEIRKFNKGYWSKHNGVWCVPCGESLRPKVSVAFSRAQANYFIKISKII